MQKLIVPFLLAASVAHSLDADAITIDTVPVGNPGNAPDAVVMTTDGTSGYGSVAYRFRMGTYEVTNTQYAAFLNGVAATDTYNLYKPDSRAGDHDAISGITRSGSPGSYTYGVKVGFQNLPVNFVTWYDAARFANWMHNGQPSGAQNATTTEDGAYTFTGLTSVSARNAGATWFLPNENEWYKAAYYNPSTSTYFTYPTSSNAAPSNSFIDAGNNANFSDGGFTTGSPYLTEVGHFATSESPYGTYDMGGNVWEWNEAVIDITYFGLRGSSFINSGPEMASSFRHKADHLVDHFDDGFRVATIPEPSALALAGLAIANMLLLGRLRRR